MSSDQPASRKIAWGAWIVFAIGALLFLLGVGRFVHEHRFGLIDALYCCLAIIPAGLLLLVFDYVLHHARLALIVPLAAAGMLIFTSPVFDVALGLVLMGVVAGTAWREWNNAKR